MSRKLLRGVGLALIAMPEPFTTPLGVGLLAASWVLAKRQDAQRRAYLRHLLKEYLHTYRPFGHGAPSELPKPVHIPFKGKEPLLHARKSISFRVGSRGYSWPDEPKTQTKMVYHTFDRGRLFRRPDTGGTRRGFEGFWGAKTRMDLKVVDHNLRKAFSLT
jgi:hypothetical protein